MRIATYNIWNNPTFWSLRFPALCAELARIDADIVGLQEVPMLGNPAGNADAAHALAAHLSYPYVVSHPYPDEPAEGLAFLSKHSLVEIAPLGQAQPGIGCACGLRIAVELDGMRLALTTVHLDWSDIARRETQITEILAWIETAAPAGGYEVLCGDFNCPPESSVYRFLMGQQTIAARSTQPWVDVASYAAYQRGTSPLPTLDFARNPRWQQSHTLELPMRVDWLLLRSPYGQIHPSIHGMEVFGIHPLPDTGIVPSDHYGVMADVRISAV